MKMKKITKDTTTKALLKCPGIDARFHKKAVKSPVIGYWLSVISFQFSVFSSQLSVLTSHLSPPTSQLPTLTSHLPPLTSYLITLFLFLALLSPAFSGGTKTLRLDDYVYEENIRTALLYTNTGTYGAQLEIPAMSLSQPYTFTLEFDELGADPQGYYYKIIHCNADWKQSILLESEFLSNFMNDYLITTYNISFNTKVKFSHYECTLPHLKISGNYVVMVYRGSNTDDVILTKRFLIYDDKITISPAIKISQGVEERFTHQQVDFTIDYKEYNQIFNPNQDVKVVLRQNGRWDNAITNLKPLYVKESESLLDYNFFNLENNFPGGNEFRMFDTRKVRASSINIERIESDRDQTTLYVMTDKDRSQKVYIFNYDTDGRYVIGNDSVVGTYGDPDYVNVVFTLKTTEMPFGNIYVLGAFNDFKPGEKYKMQYDATTDTYRCKVLLKQGYYNYIYGVKGIKDTKADEYDLEGSFFQTENTYEIIVYNRPVGGRSDLIIGYYKVKYNSQ